MVDFKKLLDKLHQEKQNRLYDDVLCRKCSLNLDYGDWLGNGHQPISDMSVYI